MRVLVIFLGSVFLFFGLTALFGIWAARNLYITHNPTILVGEYIRKTGGEWPSSWAEMEAMGFSRPMNHDRVAVAWDVDPFEILREGRIVGNMDFEMGSCPVVYEITKKPEGGFEWVLPVYLADVLREQMAKP